MASMHATYPDERDRSDDQQGAWLIPTDYERHKIMDGLMPFRMTEITGAARGDSEPLLTHIPDVTRDATHDPPGEPELSVAALSILEAEKKEERRLLKGAERMNRKTEDRVFEIEAKTTRLQARNERLEARLRDALAETLIPQTPWTP